jgi:inositol transport system ATP-binding protein
MADACVLQVRNLSKSFPGVQALAEVRLDVEPGQVHALMGENGAGKTTLMRILSGLDSPDTAEIWFKGRPVRLRSPHDALKLGIAMIHQELLPFPDLSVAENIFMGQEPASRWLGWIDRPALHREAQRLLERLSVAVPPTRTMKELSVAEMQTVEIAKALAHRVEVLIMDEPTSAISEREVEALFRVIADLKQQGVAVIYISHKMDEVFRIADRVTVLRDGRFVASHRMAELNQDQLIRLMVGRELGRISHPERGRPTSCSAGLQPAFDPGTHKANNMSALHQKADGKCELGSVVSPSQAAPGGVALAVRGLSRAGEFQDVHFELRRGEILGLAGLMGAGRTELVSAIFGLAPAEAGEIIVHGQATRIANPAHAMALGIAMVSEDRKKYGLVLKMSVQHNLTLASLGRCCRGGWIDRAKESQLANDRIHAFSIKTPHRTQTVSLLSGGNQQKVVMAKALLTDPAILLLDEPTRGIDIGAKTEVYALIARLAREGKAILMVSSELPEILSLSDRILVMREGSITAELDPGRTSQEEILSFAMPG